MSNAAKLGRSITTGNEQSPSVIYLPTLDRAIRTVGDNLDKLERLVPAK
jgi:hypothetical protein